MLVLRDLLKALALDSRASVKLEVMSGRRPRLVAGADVTNLADEILSDEEVIDLCREASGGRKLDELSDRPMTWTHSTPRGNLQVTVALRGREVAASFAVLRAPERPAERHTEGPRPEARRIEVRAPDSRSARTEPAWRPQRAEGLAAVTINRSPPEGTRDSATNRGMKAIRRLSREMESVSRTVRNAAGGATRAPVPRGEPDIGAMRPRRSPSRDTHTRALDRNESSPPRVREEPAPARKPTPPPRKKSEPAQPARTAQTARPPRTEQVRDARAGDARAAEAVRPKRESELITTDELNHTPLKAQLAPAPVAARGPTAPMAAAAPEPPPAKRAEPQPGRSSPLLELVVEARRLGASDLHLAPGAPAYVRIAGALNAMRGRRELGCPELDQMISSVVPESLRAQLADDGGVNFAISLDATVRARINATVTLAGPKLSVRLLHAAAPTIEELELPPELEQAIAHPQGLVVLTGPSGHGKTTTLAALVDRINTTRAAHIIVVEDPVEIPFSSKRSIVSQRQIGVHARSFERALKGALRQDPDVIVVGELRDVTTVRMALSASETGHLVLGTMNTPTTEAVIDRLIDLFPPGDQPQVRATLAGGLRMIAGQRLVPRADGKGRIAVCELLPGSVALWSLIREDKTFQIPSLMQRGRGAGILRFIDSLSDLVKKGTITKEQALQVANEPEELERLLSDKPATRPREPDAATPAASEELGLAGFLSKAGAIFTRRGGG